MGVISNRPRINLQHSLFVLTLLLSVILLGTADATTTDDVSFALFYLVPVVLATWTAGLRYGVCVATFSGLVWGMAERHGQPHVEMPFLLWNTMVRLVFFNLTAVLVQISLALKSERRLARVDPTTGVANKRAFMEALRLEIARSKRRNEPMTLAYLDIDNFKRVNDEHGHTIGDKVLRATAETASASVREYDTVARIGGDEFALLLSGMRASMAERVLADLHDKLTYSLQRSGWPVTFSMGAITYLAPDLDADEMMKQTDAMMYDVKKHGKNDLRYETRGATKSIDAEAD